MQIGPALREQLDSLPVFLNREDLQELFDLSYNKLSIYLSRGQFPKGVKIGKSRRWSKDEIIAYLENIDASDNASKVVSDLAKINFYSKKPVIQWPD